MGIIEIVHCTFEQAKRLKEIGFPQRGKFLSDVYLSNGECYFINLPQSLDEEFWEAPNLEEVKTWLRRTKNICLEVLRTGEGDFYYTIDDVEHIKCYMNTTYPNYEAALSAGVDEVLKVYI